MFFQKIHGSADLLWSKYAFWPKTNGTQRNTSQIARWPSLAQRYAHCGCWGVRGSSELPCQLLPRQCSSAQPSLPRENQLSALLHYLRKTLGKLHFVCSVATCSVWQASFGMAEPGMSVMVKREGRVSIPEWPLPPWM